MPRKFLCLLFAIVASNLSGCTAWYAIEQWKCDTFGLCMPGYVRRCPGAYHGAGGYAPGGYPPSGYAPGGFAPAGSAPGGSVPYPAAPYGGYGGVVSP